MRDSAALILTFFQGRMGKNYRNTNKTSTVPRRPFEKERLNAEMKLLGEYGLRCKREIWRVMYTLAKCRTIARTLLTLPEKDPKRYQPHSLPHPRRHIWHSFLLRLLTRTPLDAYIIPRLLVCSRARP
jgi:hypothetical protein